jgi:hypothetical protein
MRKILVYILIVVVSVFFTDCEENKCFHSVGDQITEILCSGEFISVQVLGIFDVELVSDTAYFVEGIGGENVIAHIEGIIKNDSLFLYNYNQCFWLRDYKKPVIRVHFNDIKTVDLHEACYVFSVDSIMDDFSINVRSRLGEMDLILNNSKFGFVIYRTTGGYYRFRGKTDNFFLAGFYNTVCDASDLEAGYADIRNSSIADYKICVNDELRFQIHNRGNILLKGNPEILFDSVTSTGKLIYLD